MSFLFMVVVMAFSSLNVHCFVQNQQLNREQLYGMNDNWWLNHAMSHIYLDLHMRSKFSRFLPHEASPNLHY